jgi:FAD/FMN-containing dehydrogenase
MRELNPSRRAVLKKLASMSVIGALTALRSGALFAGEPPPARQPKLIPKFKGKIVGRQDPDYELWRQAMVWHASKPDRHPDLIVQARSAADVAEAVRYAARNKLKVAVRSGGHSATGASLRDGGMCIDLSALGSIEIDETNRIASIGPGVRSLGLIRTAGERGLCFPGPHCPSVGLGGFLMGGGIGWNYSHRGGMSTLSIDSAQVVTADGKIVEASARQNPDLLWAIRGAGPGFFGVVTRFDISLYPAPKAIVCSSYIHPLDGVATVTAALEQLTTAKDSRVEVLALFIHSPDAPPDAPPEQAKVCFVSAFAFADTEAEARTMLEPFAASDLAAKALAREDNQVFDFTGLYFKYFGPEAIGGRLARYACDSIITDQADRAMLALVDHFRKAPSRSTHVLAAYSLNLEARADACLSSIAKHYVGCFSVWDEEKDDDANHQWLDQTLPFMDPYARGHYINEVAAQRHPERIEACFSPANWQRLQELRRQYDPEGVFHAHLGQS